VPVRNFIRLANVCALKKYHDSRTKEIIRLECHFDGRNELEIVARMKIDQITITMRQLLGLRNKKRLVFGQK
jgi:hypothetical protein